MTTKKYTFPPELITAIEKENLIVFVGAGLSLDLKNTKDQKIGNWDNLVLQILKNVKNDDTDLLIPLVGKFDPVDILDLLEKNKNVNVGKVKDFTKSFFDLHSENDLSVHEKICKLTDQIITTNYDCAFEEANPQLRKNIAHTGNKHELVNFTKSNVPTLFKLHGTYERSDSMILFSSDYDTLYVNPDSDSELTLLTLRNTILNKTVLFIGCSMSDFQINELFQYIKKLKGIYNQKHFIITKDTLDSSLEFLEAIFIEDYIEITAVIEQLLKEKEHFSKKKTPEQELLEKQIEEAKQTSLILKKRLKETLSDSERKDALLERESLKYFSRGVKFQDEHEHEKACNEYEFSSELNPNYANTFYNWGVALYNIAKQNDRLNYYSEAGEKFKIATEINPKISVAFYNWGTTLNNLGRLTNNPEYYLQACEKYAIVTTIDQKNSFHLINWTNTILKLYHLTQEKNLLEEALEKAAKAYKLDSNPYNMACVHALKEDKEKALKYLEICLENKQVPIDHIDKDNDWDFYRDDSDFIVLLDRYRHG